MRLIYEKSEDFIIERSGRREFFSARARERRVDCILIETLLSAGMVFICPLTHSMTSRKCPGHNELTISFPIVDITARAGEHARVLFYESNMRTRCSVMCFRNYPIKCINSPYVKSALFDKNK